MCSLEILEFLRKLLTVATRATHVFGRTKTMCRCGHCWRVPRRGRPTAPHCNPAWVVVVVEYYRPVPVAIWIRRGGRGPWKMPIHNRADRMAMGPRPAGQCTCRAHMHAPMLLQFANCTARGTGARRAGGPPSGHKPPHPGIATSAAVIHIYYHDRESRIIYAMPTAPIARCRLSTCTVQLHNFARARARAAPCAARALSRAL